MTIGAEHHEEKAAVCHNSDMALLPGSTETFQKRGVVSGPLAALEGLFSLMFSAVEKKQAYPKPRSFEAA